ncbi:MAG: hypothetical protein WA655_20305, partial [Candidatus Korobacteraceae bacterium]
MATASFSRSRRKQRLFAATVAPDLRDAGLKGAQLYRLLKNSGFGCFVSRHDFSRADKPVYFYYSERASETVSQPKHGFFSGTNGMNR